jgi:4-aminobutyrate aminotransferase/(S)-3-amino-2-methylpropionate transaminase
MLTAVPGPKSKELLAHLNESGGGGGAIKIFVDIEKSHGCYMVDADGNKILDAFGMIASLPLGYNHPQVMEAARTPAWQRASTHRTALGMMPPTEYPSQCTDTLMSIAPVGMDCVQTMLCGSSANENAFKAAFMRYRGNEREAAGIGRTDFTQEEMDSCMINEGPGCPELSILSFEGGFHGRTFGALAATHSKAVHKLDVPSLPWPCAPFPRLEYPLDENADANRAEEERCLAAVDRIFNERKGGQVRGGPVAGVIVEPVQSEGGDNHATPFFFIGLQAICHRHGAAFMVDEVQTGLGACGNIWCHEAWELTHPPDFVSFSKKTQVGGYYYRSESKPTMPYRIFNTWMGDPCKLLHLEVIMDVIRQDGLLEGTRACGDALLAGLLDQQSQHPEVLSRARSAGGTFCAVDAATPKRRDEIVARMLNLGVMVGACGNQTIRFRPPLIFTEKDVSILIDAMGQAIRDTAPPRSSL